MATVAGAHGLRRAVPSGLGEPIINPLVARCSEAFNSLSWSSVGPVAKTRSTFAAIAAEIVTNLPGAIRTLFT